MDNSFIKANIKNIGPFFRDPEPPEKKIEWPPDKEKDLGHPPLVEALMRPIDEEIFTEVIELKNICT